LTTGHADWFPANRINEAEPRKTAICGMRFGGRPPSICESLRHSTGNCAGRGSSRDCLRLRGLQRIPFFFGAPWHDYSRRHIDLRILDVMNRPATIHELPFRGENPSYHGAMIEISMVSK